MSDYVPPDSAVAEKIHRTNQESREQYQRLEHAPAEQLRQIVSDITASSAARGNALLFLLQRRDAALPELLPELFEDRELGHMAIRYCRPTRPIVLERLRGLLNHPRDRVWPGAAMALARAKDESLRPRLLDWFQHGDQGHRNLAIEALIALDSPEAAKVCWESWSSGGRDEEDCLILSAALLRLGETRVLASLEAAAKRAEGAWAVFAATAIVDYDAASGYRLMLWIVEHGDLEAKQALVMHFWNMAGLRHAFTADAIHETRFWIEQQLQAHETRL